MTSSTNLLVYISFKTNAATLRLNLSQQPCLHASYATRLASTLSLHANRGLRVQAMEVPPVHGTDCPQRHLFVLVHGDRGVPDDFLSFHLYLKLNFPPDDLLVVRGCRRPSDVN